MRIGIDFNHGLKSPRKRFLNVVVTTPGKAPRHFSLESVGPCDTTSHCDFAIVLEKICDSNENDLACDALN
jgi:hypothetical protein